MNDVRNLKLICSLLHQLRNRERIDTSPDGLYDLNEMIATAEAVYHEKKGC